MQVIARTNDPIRLSFLIALLKDAGIESIVLDSYINGAEGGIGAFPRRLAVAEEDESRAWLVLRQAGEA